MFGTDCTAALATTLAAMEMSARLWEARAPGRWAGTLTTDVAYWATEGVETVADLLAMLDAECERERRKDDLWPEMTEEELAEDAADLAAYRAEREAEAREAAELAALALWDYDVDDRGRVRFAA